MRYELYIDSMFFLHFVLNLYVLILLNHTVDDAAATTRILIGAVIGAVGAIIPLLFDGPILLKIILEILIGTMGMLMVTFSPNGVRAFLNLLRKAIVLTFCIGGMLVFLQRILRGYNGVFTCSCMLLGGGGISFLFINGALKGQKESNSVCDAILVCGKNRIKIKALIDSGNGLVEPISGKPVSVVEKGIFTSLWETKPTGFRAIPYHSLGKTGGILEGYLLPELYLERNGIQRKVNDVYIAVNPEAKEDESEFGETVKMIINPNIFEGKIFGNGG